MTSSPSPLLLGLCVCGEPIFRHRTIAGRQIGCLDLRRIDEALKASTPLAQNDPGPGHEFHAVDDPPQSRVLDFSRAR